ncbi:hypothetical protein BS50DRAFT_150714 [Corynespora cassiicola Philippines]|uniref:Uncharacterized protein n=1 Tax=Corynespora cassiicola Philippines TaxID=1448308 RepID=A0A2T2N7L8_CORCC|nr:hypothetical protein BS50DRAFT_150714 [Corynespora cassiicola Philippines]
MNGRHRHGQSNHITPTSRASGLSCLCARCGPDYNPEHPPPLPLLHPLLAISRRLALLSCLGSCIIIIACQRPFSAADSHPFVISAPALPRRESVRVGGGKQAGKEKKNV